MRLCTVEGCGKIHLAKGYCQNHYRVWQRRGTPTKPPAKVWIATGGYLFQSIKKRTSYLHSQIAERALGHPLPPGAELHHIDGNPANNEPGNLVICPNHEYHMLLHQRTRALEACGNAGWRKCKICCTYDDPALMRPTYKQFYHRACGTEQSRQRRANQRSK